MSWIGIAIGLAVLFNVVRSIRNAGARYSAGPVDSNASRIQRNRQVILDLQARGTPIPASAYAMAGLASPLPQPVATARAARTPSPPPKSTALPPPSLAEIKDLPDGLLSAESRRNPGALHGFFEDGKSVRRAVIAAEIFGPPRALKERTPWQI
ncbi:MAG: hypothetical protein M3Y21_03025 [Candidatus Eremiobacteraeota bacterium]|nr:hypothetical protein [Candidatus Eremiobacteraeota bacterium]